MWMSEVSVSKKRQSEELAKQMREWEEQPGNEVTYCKTGEIAQSVGNFVSFEEAAQRGREAYALEQQKIFDD